MTRAIFIALILALSMPTAALAVVDNMTRSNISEAREFGRANNKNIEETLLRLYSVRQESACTDEVTVRTKWCKLAILEGIKAQQGRDASAEDQDLILRDPNLQLDITVYGSTPYFARDYTVSALQEGNRIQPDMLHADHFQITAHAQKTLHGSPAYYAIIRTYFSYAALKLNRPLTLELKKESGGCTHEIDLSKFK